MNPHSTLVNEVLLRLGRRRDVKVWRQNHVEGRMVRGGQEAYVNSGPDGQGDIGGIILGWGRRLDIECKTGRATQRASQVKWQAMAQSMGGLYLVARSVDDAERQLDAALTEMWTALHERISTVTAERFHEVKAS